MENKWYKYMKEGINNKIKGETNVCPKQGDTPVKQGDMQGAVVGYNKTSTRKNKEVLQLKSI